MIINLLHSREIEGEATTFNCELNFNLEILTRAQLKKTNGVSLVLGAVTAATGAFLDFENFHVITSYLNIYGIIL